MTLPTKIPSLALHGGAPTRSKPWPTYDKGDDRFDGGDEEAVLRVLKSRRLFRYDDRLPSETEVGKLEAEISQAFDVPHTLTCSSGTAAIALALLGAGLQPGARVGCPAFTFAATPSAIMLAGGRPTLIEVDEDLHMDIDDLAAKLDQLDALVVVHMRGFASDVRAICALAAERGIPVIEDAVPLMGVSLDGQKLGSFGVAGAFSFQSDKTINTGEGGCLITSDHQLCARAAVYSGAFEGRVRRHGLAQTEVFDERELPLLSLRMDELRAALARVQLGRLDERIATHQRNYVYVAERLADLDGVVVRRPVAPQAFLGEALVFRVVEGEGPWFARALRAEGIDARCFGDPEDMNVRAFWNWKFAFPGLSSGAIAAQAPRSAAYLSDTVDVPLSCSLGEADLDDVVTAIRKVSANMCPATAGCPTKGLRVCEVDG